MGLDAGPKFKSDLEQFTKAMDFVMITEKFTESILVMRKLLCMDFMDLYVQPKKVKTHDAIEYSMKQKTRFYQFNNYDAEMYHHFNNSFDEQVEKIYGKTEMEIDSRRLVFRRIGYFCQERKKYQKLFFRLKIIRTFCDKKENIKECIEQANKARTTYRGKDERNYWPNDVEWPKMAEYMAEAGGACPYGVFKSVIRNKT